MLEDSRCNSMVRMRVQPGIAHVAHHLVGGQILGQRTGAIEMRLHAGIERVQPALQHSGLVRRQIKLGQATALKQGMRALSRGIHTMALELRARHRSGNELARSPTCTHAIERFERQRSTQPQRIAAKSRRHGVVNNQQRMGLTRRPTQRTQIGHTQTNPADGVNEPPQVRTLGIKRSIKTLGRCSKRISRRRTHQRDITAIKAARKRFGKVIRKGHQAVTGTHDSQQRQRCRHMPGSDKTRLTRAGSQSPGIF